MRRKCSYSNSKDDNESNENDTAVRSSSKQQQQDGPQPRRSDARPPKPTAKSIAAKSKSTAANEDDKLKRPRSAYIIFLQEYAANLQPSDNTQFGSRAGEAWRLLSAEEKQKYQTICDRERLDYKLTKDENANKQRRNADNIGDNPATTKNNNYNDGSEGGAVTSSTVLENFEQNPTLPPPRIPKSSYLHFFEDWKEKWRRENPEESKNAKMSILSQLAGEEWRSMNSMQKQPWVDKVVQEKQIYTTWKLVKSSSFKSLLNLQESSSKEEEKGGGGGKEEGDTEKKNNDDDNSNDAAAAGADQQQQQQQQQQQRKKKRQRPAKKATNTNTTNTLSSLKKDNSTNNDSHHDSILITTNNNNSSGDFSLPPLPPNKKRSGNLSQLLSGSDHLPPPALPLPKYQRVHVDAFPLPFPLPLQVHQQHLQSAPLFMHTAGSGSGSGSGSEMNRVLSYNSATDAAAITKTNTSSTSQQLDMVSNPTIKDRSDSTPHFVPANAVNPIHPPSSSTAAVSHHRMFATSTSAVLDPSPFSNIAPCIQNAYKGDAAVMVTAMTAHNALPSFPPPPPPHRGIVDAGDIDVIPSTVAVLMMVQTINNPHLQQHVPPLNVQQQQAQHLEQQLLHNPHNPLLSLPPPSLQQHQQQKQQQQEQAAAFDSIDDKLMHAEAMVSIIENKIKKQ